MMLKSVANKQLSLKLNRTCCLVRAKASCEGWDSVSNDYFDCPVVGSEPVSSIM